MNFVGPQDPDMHRNLDGAHATDLVLVVAAGNAGRNRRRSIRRPIPT
jgi:hypothetical protein